MVFCLHRHLENPSLLVDKHRLLEKPSLPPHCLHRMWTTPNWKNELIAKAAITYKLEPVTRMSPEEISGIRNLAQIKFGPNRF